MSKSRIISPLALLFPLVVLVSGSCDVINLDQLTYTTFPAQRDAVLGAADPVWIEFSVPVEKESTEMLFKVLSPAKSQEGDFSWQGNRLVFTPQTAYDPGMRYVLSFSGEVRTNDGRRFPAAAAVPFFSVTADLPAQLAAADPASGAMIGSGASLSFTFTKSMDTAASINDIFSLAPAADFTHEWQTAGTVLVIHPVGQWTANEVYKWTIESKLMDETGIAIFQAYEGNFLVQDPAAPAPVIASLEPGINSWDLLFPPDGGTLLPAARQNNWIAYNDAIRINFQTPDKPLPDNPARIDPASLRKAFSITPSINFDIQAVKTADNRDDFFVVVPKTGQRFLMDTLYHVKISRELKNMAGVALPAEFEARFTANIPAISIDQIELTNADPNLVLTPDKFNSYDYSPIKLDPAESPSNYIITFNAGFTIADTERYAIADKIRLSTVFPEAGSSYSRSNVLYQIGTRNQLTVSFYFSAAPAVGTIFRLSIKGGTDGVVDNRGSYLPRDVFIYFQITN